MSKRTGQRVALSLSRKWISDLMWICRGMPLVAVESRLELSLLMSHRQQMSSKIPWSAIFLKVYAQLAKKHVELRQSYQSYPWPHLYQADDNFASISILREFEGQQAVFFGFITAPECQSLAELSRHIEQWKRAPAESIRPFARLIRYSRYPMPIRRALWWLGMHLSGRHRAKTIGTFGMTTVAGLGADIVNVISPTATTLTYGPFDETGRVTVRITFDHRVIDGAKAAQVLQELAMLMNSEMLTEMLQAER